MRIGDAARRLNLHPQTLRRWEREGRTPKARRNRSTGQRQYQEEDVQQLEKLIFSKAS